MDTYNKPHEHGMGLFTRSTMRWEIGMKVTVKNLPMHLVFGEYNGQECEVLEEFHSRQYGTSLRVRATDGREFTVGPAQYIAPKADAARFAALAKSERKQFMAPGLRRIQRYSARCTT